MSCASAKDESPAASPAVCVDSPPYQERYNGDVVDDAGMTAVMTESPTEPGHSESDSFTMTERVSVIRAFLCLFNLLFWTNVCHRNREKQAHV